MNDALLVVLRLIHVVGGALWVGMAVYTTVYLVPAIQDAGPDGGKVMAALQRRGILTVLPALALLTIVSGGWLYWRASAGLDGGFLRSGVGLAFGLGGLASVAAYVLGITVLRPSMTRAAKLMGEIGPDTSEGERRARLEEAGRHRARGAMAGQIVAALLLLALAAMAVARYL
ncbi:MAG TPA: hypothetical protein VEB59_05355 [Gemmatimonadales bacterium]|nr:hypothetical protein [Gemmatimonadales bacterium]